MRITMKTTYVSGAEALPEPYATMAGDAHIFHKYASMLMMVYKDDIRVTREGEFVHYENVPQAADVTMDIIGLAVAASPGQDVDGWPAWFEVTDKTESIPDGSGRTWGDLETATQKYNEIGGKYYIGTQALFDGVRYAKGSELVGRSWTVLSKQEYLALF